MGEIARLRQPAVGAVLAGPFKDMVSSPAFFVEVVIGGIAAGLIPPVVVWFVGLKLFKLNAAVLLGAVCGARFSTPGLRVAQEESGSAIPAVGYPVPKAITATIVLITGYLALFF